ncbi:hypothetical protein BJ508DRAFT_337142, partial [Ascobolus immersus RN42]
MSSFVHPNSFDYPQNPQQQNGSPLYNSSLPTPFTPHSAASVEGLHQRHLAGHYGFPLAQPVFTPHSFQQLQTPTSFDTSGNSNKDTLNAILARLERLDETVHTRLSSSGATSTPADATFRQPADLPQQTDNDSPTSAARTNNATGTTTGSSGPTGTSEAEVETPLEDIEEGLANVPTTVRRDVENLVHEFEAKLRNLRRDDKESSEELYTEEDLLLTA